MEWLLKKFSFILINITSFLSKQREPPYPCLLVMGLFKGPNTLMRGYTMASSHQNLLQQYSSGLEQHEMGFGLGDDPNNIMRLVSGASVGILAALSMWFNDIINEDAKFSIKNFIMLIFIGGTIGGIAITAAPLFHVDDKYVTVFAAAAGAAHKYIFKASSWFLKKWTSA